MREPAHDFVFALSGNSQTFAWRRPAAACTIRHRAGRGIHPGYRTVKQEGANRKAGLLATKPLDALLAEAQEHGEHALRRVLGPINLVTLGIGAIIGAGIFVLTGTVSAQFAGPGIVISFLVAAIGCVFAGLCYAEFASLIPIAGSAYTYGYATLAKSSHGSSDGT